MARRAIALSAILIAVIVVAAGILLMVQSQQANNSPESQVLTGTQWIIDMTGRNVTVPNNVTRIIGVNYGCLRLITYLNASALVCGVEQVETSLAGRPYAMAHPEYANLPVIGPQFGGDAELIAAQHPDVVFATGMTASDLDSLQSRLGIPVVGLVYGGLGTPDERQTFYDSITLIGKVLHREARANAVINYVKGLINDLNARTSNIPDSSKPSVYVGGLSSRGNHGFTSTSAYYAPFVLVNAKNVITPAIAKNSTQVVNVDLEAIPALNPDIIFVDYNGLSLSIADVKNHWDLFSQLSAIQGNRTYGVMGYNWYALNFDTVLADAYYVGKVIYPDRFADIDPAKKADEIYTFLDGAPLYDQMVQIYGPFGPVNLNE